MSDITPYILVISLFFSLSFLSFFSLLSLFYSLSALKKTILTIFIFSILNHFKFSHSDFVSLFLFPFFLFLFLIFSLSPYYYKKLKPSTTNKVGEKLGITISSITTTAKDTKNTAHSCNQDVTKKTTLMCLQGHKGSHSIHKIPLRTLKPQTYSNTNIYNKPCFA